MLDLGLFPSYQVTYTALFFWIQRFTKMKYLLNLRNFMYQILMVGEFICHVKLNYLFIKRRVFLSI